MSHPSLFELAQFIDRGDGDAAFETHVDGCSICAGTLTRLAQRSLSAKGLAHERPSRTVSPMVTVLACFSALALVVALKPASASAQQAPVTVVAPEGVHGVPVEHSSFVVFPAAVAPADGGPGCSLN